MWDWLQKLGFKPPAAAEGQPSSAADRFNK